MRLFLRAICLIGLLVPAAKAEDLPEWRIGTVAPNGDAGMLYMGSRGGFGTAFGIDMKMVPLKGDPLLLKAMLAGELEAYIGGPPSPMVAASRGADVKIVGCGWNKQTYRFWANASAPKIADLRGKVLGVSTPGSAPDIFMRAALNAVGIAPNEVQFVAAGMPPDLISATANGVVAGTATPAEYEVRAGRMGLHAVANSEDVTPLSPNRCYFVPGATVSAHPDRVARFLAAEMAAYEWSIAHREPTIALTRLIIHAPADAPEPIAGYDNPIRLDVLDLTFEPPMEKLRWLAGALGAGGQMKPGFDPAGMVDLGPLKMARQMKAEMGAKASAGTAAALAKDGIKIE